MKDKSIQEEIRNKIVDIIDESCEVNYYEHITHTGEAADEILKYLDSKGVVVATWHEGELYDGFERLVEE